MNAIFETVNALGIRFINFAVPMLIQSSLLILILLFIDALLQKKVRAVFRYWIWVVVLLKLVLPTSLSLPVSLGRWLGNELPYVEMSRRIAESHIETEIMPPTPVAVTLSTNSTSAETNINPTVSPRVSVTSADTVVPEEEPAPMEHKPKAPTPIQIAKLSWQGVLFLLWLSVVIAIGLFLLQRVAVVRDLVAQAKEADDSMSNLLEDCCKHMRIRGTVGLRVSVNATSPAVCGLFRPVILIPENLATSLSSNQLQVVLLHELAHIKRGDLWVNLAQTILQILYFYNPLLWPANAITRRVREQAVDETVLVAMGKNAMQYPQTLLEVARLAFRHPVMSLRLIGVAESRDALTVRIKRILSRPIPKTAKLSILSLLVIIIAAAILLPMGKAMQPKPFVVNKGPLDIRLVGVCPDGGRQIYDASGRKLKATMGALGPFNTNWKNEEQYRDFLFEIPDVNSQVVFLPVSRIWIAGINRVLGGGYGGYFGPTDNPPTLIQSITFARSYKRQVLYFFQAQNEIHQIDLKLRYLYGPRREATCTFTGPFILGQTTQADSNSPYSLTPVQSKGFPRYSGTDLLLATSMPFHNDTIVVVYDLQGRRYLLDSSMDGGGRRGANITFRDIRLPLNEIAVITIGEKPYEITFKNIAVDFPDRPYRTYPELLDQMSERLGLVDMSPEELAQYNFRNPQEAIDVIDIVRGGWHIRKIFEAIRHGKPKIDITKLDQATQDKIHRAATEWAKTGYLAKYGISLGIMGRWPEFFDMAIERLGQEFSYTNGYPYYEQTWRQDNAGITNTMVNYKMDQLAVKQVQKIKELILKTDNDSVLKRLLWYLVQTKSQATTDALWELAQNEKPWIWWKATEAWYSRTSRTRGVYDDLSEKMKLRLILIEDKIRDENLDDKALKSLPEIFTPELGKMASDIWDEVRKRISRQFDKKVATEIFVNYLRQLQSEMTARQWISNSSFKSKSKWMAAYIIRTLNVWYGTNIASLGTDETRESSNQEPRSFYEFQNLIAQPIQWYDGNEQAEPVDLPFAGKILDTAGNPIAGAKLSFTKQEDYKDEQGYQGQRTVDVGQCTTDDNGKFSFGDLTNDRYITLNIIADGYLPKEEIHIYRLTDGRYRYDEQNAPQDNVVVLQRPGKISGIFFGADGKPFANAELRLSSVNRYSRTSSIKTVTTNSEGKFAARDISKGHFLLSYADLRTVPYGQGFRQEYEGRCGAVSLEVEEAGHLTNVVLDLSKSDCSLELHVVDDANKPVQDINISFGTEMEGSAYKYATIFFIRKVSKDGVYCFEGMPPGTWCLYINDDSFRFEPKKIYVKLSREKTAYYKVICK